MKKLLFLAILSSSLIGADALSVAQESSDQSVIVAQNQYDTTLAAKVFALVHDLVKSSCAQGKEHYILAGSSIAGAGLIALYYSNSLFRDAVNAWLSHKVTAQ